MARVTLASPRVQPPAVGAPFHAWVLPDGTPWTEFHRTDKGYLLRFPGLVDFEVTADGSGVTATPAPQVSADTVQHLYLNQVLPLVLSKAGKLVFHGSAVELHGGAVVFAAPSGRGKSTLAASFAVNGFRFLTDDGLVLESKDAGHVVLPSHPSIRLWADSEEALFPPGTETAPPLSYSPKARFLAGERVPFCAEPRPLRRVYFLGEGSAEAVTITPLSPAEALVEWLKHSFLLDIEERPRLASHFDQVATLANRRIHFRLDYPRRFEELPRLRETIAHHVRGEGDVV